MLSPLKYPLAKDFWPLRFILLSITDMICRTFWEAFANLTALFTFDTSVTIKKLKVGPGNVEVQVIRPKSAGDKKIPALVYYHGGGFVFDVFGPQEDLMYQYIERTGCALVLVDYRLCPSYAFPDPFIDAYETLKLTFEQADEFGIDAARIVVGGDSAGGDLAAAVCLKARDEGKYLPKAQMLVYPVTDDRMQTQSAIKFVDTPVWNATESKTMWAWYLKNGIPEGFKLEYAAPNRAENFEGLPTAYVETAEFDSLRDEAIEYADKLAAAGVETEVLNTKGTCHGFELISGSSITKASVDSRVAFLKRMFA